MDGRQLITGIDKVFMGGVVAGFNLFVGFTQIQGSGSSAIEVIYPLVALAIGIVAKVNLCVIFADMEGFVKAGPAKVSSTACGDKATG